MIKPSVGRVVWFKPGAWDAKNLAFNDDQPLAALVTYVWNDRLVNLVVFDANGQGQGRTSVPLIQDDDVVPEGFYAQWMPYQKGQAAKTEALEQRMEGRR